MEKTIIRKIRAVRRRLLWITACRLILIIAAWVIAAVALFVLVGRLVPLPAKLMQVAPWTAGAAGIWFLVWLWRRRVRLLEAAVRADQALKLKERLSTALLLGQPRNEAETAVVADAAAHASRIRLRRDFPLDISREARWIFASPVALALIWALMPQMNLLARQQEKQQQRAVAVEVQQEAAKELEKLTSEAAEPARQRQPEMGTQVKREVAALAKQLGEQKLAPEQALARTQTLQEKLASRRAELEKQVQMPGNLQSRGEGRQTGELSRQMEKGNFQQAAKQLEALKQKLQKGQLSEQEKTQLQKELSALAAKLGSDSPLGESLTRAANKMAAEGMNAALADLEDASGKLLDMEATLKELAALDSVDYDLDTFKKTMCSKPSQCKSCGKACLGDYCSACSGHRPWQAGDSDRRGNGMGGPGKGQGQIADKKETPTQFEKKRIPSQIGPGRIIARMKTPGEQTPGEVTTSYEAVRLEQAQQAEETIEKSTLPLEYRSLVRNYFDAIKYGKDESKVAPPNSSVPASGSPLPAVTGSKQN